VETINWNDWKPSTGTDGNLGAEQVETFTGIGTNEVSQWYDEAKDFIEAVEDLVKKALETD